MNRNKIIILILGLALILSGCIPSQYTKGVDADEYPDRDLPVYDDAIIFEYEGDDEEVSIKYGTEDDIDDVIDFNKDYFEDESIMLENEEEDKDEYTAEGYYEDFFFEINAEEASGDIEEKLFSTVVEVNIEYLSEEEIEATTENNYEGVTTPQTDESVILNQNGIIMTMKGFEESYYTLDLNVLIENTTDKEIDVYPVSIVVNGYSLQEAYMIGTVEANAKLNTEISFYLDELERCNIGEITEIELVFELYDYDSWETISVSDVIYIDLDSNYVQTYDTSGITMVNEDGIKIVYQDFVTDDDFYGPYAVFYVENNTGKAVDVSYLDLQVNGYMISAFFYGRVESGTCAVLTLEFFSSELEENGIETIETIKIAFEAYYSDDWYSFFESDLMEVPIG